MSAQGVIIWLGGELETEIVRALNQQTTRFRVVRRCGDFVETHAAALAGVGGIVIVDANADGIDARFADEMRACDVFLLLICDDPLTHVSIGEDACAPRDATQALSILVAGIQHKILTTLDHEDLGDVWVDTEDVVASEGEDNTGGGIDSAAWAIDVSEPGDSAANQDSDEDSTDVVFTKSTQRGSIIAVWGTAGAPGRSTIAMHIAHAIARDQPAIIVDADLAEPSQILLHGLGFEASGVAQVVRNRNLGHNGAHTPRELCTELTPTLALLTGLTRADQWRQIPAEPLADAIESLADYGHVVVDLGSGMGESDPSQLTFVPRPEDINSEILTRADRRILVVRADAIGMSRLPHALNQIRDLEVPIDVIVVNRAQRATIGTRNYSGVHTVMGSMVEDIPYVVIDEDIAVSRALMSCEVARDGSEPSSMARVIDTLISALKLDAPQVAATVSEPAPHGAPSAGESPSGEQHTGDLPDGASTGSGSPGGVVQHAALPSRRARHRRTPVGERIARWWRMCRDAFAMPH